MVPRAEDCVESAEQNFNQVGSVEVVEIFFPEIPFIACLDTCDDEVVVVFL